MYALLRRPLAQRVNGALWSEGHFRPDEITGPDECRESELRLESGLSEGGTRNRERAFYASTRAREANSAAAAP